MWLYCVVAEKGKEVCVVSIGVCKGPPFHVRISDVSSIAAVHQLRILDVMANVFFSG